MSRLRASAYVLGALTAAACSGTGADDRAAPEPAVSSPGTAEQPTAAAPAETRDAGAGPIATTTTPPSAPPAPVPTTAPPACAGMGGTEASPIAVMRPIGVDVQNAVTELVLGAGYRTNALGNEHPLERLRGHVAAGAPELADFSSGTGRSSSSFGFLNSVSSDDFGSIFPNDDAGTLYLSQSDRTTPPRAWARAAATDPTSLLTHAGVRALATYRAVRVDLARTASLGSSERQGPDWGNPQLDRFVRSAQYSRYFAYAVQIRFDSECKRDTFLYRAGGSRIDDILPAEDKNALGRYLVDAKASMMVAVITLGQAAQTKVVLDTTKCATNALAECRTLVQRLDGLVTNVGNVTLPTTFSGSPSGNNDWYFDSFQHSSKSFLLPP